MPLNALEVDKSLSENKINSKVENVEKLLDFIVLSRKLIRFY